MDGHRHARLRRGEAAGLRAAGRRDRPRGDPGRPPVHHAGRRAGLDLRPAGARGRAAADALRAARVAVRQPALLAAREPAPAAEQGPAPRIRTTPSAASPAPTSYPYVAHDVPADRAPLRRRLHALHAVPLRAAAGDVRRGAPGARARARPRPRRLGDDRHGARGDRGARDGHRPHAAGARSTGACSTRSGCRTTGARAGSRRAAPRTTSRTWRSTRTSTSRRSRR